MRRWSLRAPEAAVLVVLAVFAVGAVATLANLSLPILRNALLYAQIQESLTAHGLRAWEVCANPELAFNKPCGFSLLAVPFVALFGANGGLKWASFTGTAAFLISSLLLVRRLGPRLGLTPRAMTLALALSLFNPLVVYQFWSAYPDALFAAGMLYATYTLDRIAFGDGGRRAVLLYFLVTVGCLVSKHASLLFFPLHGAYLWWYRRELGEVARRQQAVLVWLAAAGALALLFALSGVLGLNPLLNLRSNTDQFERSIRYGQHLLTAGIFLLLTVGAASFLLPLVRFRKSEGGPACLLVGFAALMSFYHGAEYNIRYYLPLLPLLGLYLARAWQALRRPWLRGLVVGLFLALNLPATVIFNQQGAYRWLASKVPRAHLNDFSVFDNLRMGSHLAVGQALEMINRDVPGQGPLLYISFYYGHGAQGVYQRAGLLRPDIQVSYLESLAGRGGPSDRGVHVFFQLPVPSLPRKGMVRVVSRLYRFPDRAGQEAPPLGTVLPAGESQWHHWERSDEIP